MQVLVYILEHLYIIVNSIDHRFILEAFNIKFWIKNGLDNF